MPISVLLISSNAEITSFIALTLVGVSIIKGAGRLDVVGRLCGQEDGRIASDASFSLCNITVGSDPMTTSGSHGKRPVFSQDLLILCLVRDSLRACRRICKNIILSIEYPAPHFVF
jgi:hypothetical protein